MQTTNISKEKLIEITDKLEDLLAEEAGKTVCYALLIGPIGGSVEYSASKSQMMSNTGLELLPKWLRDAADTVEENL